MSEFGLGLGSFFSVVPEEAGAAIGFVGADPNLVLGSRTHPRTQIQLTCTHKEPLYHFYSDSHANLTHMYTQMTTKLTCTHK